MDWLINNKSTLGVDIINISLGGPGNVDTEFCQKVDTAMQHGILTVVAGLGALMLDASNGSLTYGYRVVI